MKPHALLAIATLFAICPAITKAEETGKAKDVPKGHKTMFESLDADNNDSVSKDEAAAGKWKFISVKFDEIDADKSGSLGLEEFSAYVTQQKAKKAAGETKGEEAGKTKEVPKGHKTMFESLDADNNDGVSKDEAAAGKWKFISVKFDEIDADKNGSLSLDEFSDYVTRQKAKKAAGNQGADGQN